MVCNFFLSKQVSFDIFNLFLTPGSVVKREVIAGNEILLYPTSRLNFVYFFAPVIGFIMPE